MSTYDYNTRQIKRDFRFVRHGEKCRLGGLPAKSGGQFCRRCQYNCGSETDWKDPIDIMSFTKCKHPEAKDSKDSDNIIYLWNERFEQEALAHMYD